MRPYCCVCPCALSSPPFEFGLRWLAQALSAPDSRILYDMHGHQAASDAANKQRGDHASVEMKLTLAEVYTGVQRSLTITRRVVCKGCAATTGGGRTSARCRRCADCPPEIKPVNVQLAPGFVIQQQQEVPSEERCQQGQYVLDAHIKKGMSDGDELTFARASEQRPGMIPGDVKLRLKVEPDKRFRRAGNELHTEVQISLRQALCGFSTTITHLDGHTVHLEHRGVAKPGQVMRIEGEGMPPLDSEGAGHADDLVAGALFVKLDIVFPEELSDAAVEWAQRTLPP